MYNVNNHTFNNNKNFCNNNNNNLKRLLFKKVAIETR